MISSVKRYADLLCWLLKDTWTHGRRLIMAAYGFDVLGLATMAGAYRVGHGILTRVEGSSGLVRIWGLDLSVLGAVGIAAGLILLALLVQSAARLASQRLVLALVGRYEAATVMKTWEKLREVRSSGECLTGAPDPEQMFRIVTGSGRVCGTAARLGVTAISGGCMALCFGALAVYFVPKTALIFLVIGLAAFGLVIRNNRLAAGANCRSREHGRQARTELKKLFTQVLARNEGEVEPKLRGLYVGGQASRAREARSEQIFRVYQSQFLVSAGAAFAFAVALLLPALEKPHGGAAVSMAMTAAGLVLLKQAFGFAASAAGQLTRLNWKYQLLVEHRRFLETGRLPQVISAEGEDEEED